MASLATIAILYSRVIYLKSFISICSLLQSYIQGVEHCLQIIRKIDLVSWQIKGFCESGPPCYLRSTIHLELALNYILNNIHFKHSLLLPPPWTSIVLCSLSDQVFPSSLSILEAPTISLLFARYRNMKRPCPARTHNNEWGGNHIQKQNELHHKSLRALTEVHVKYYQTEE